LQEVSISTTIWDGLRERKSFVAENALTYAG
jgi:hypothetical protein